MTMQITADLAGFASFLQQKLENGGASLSPEQVLAQWRDRIETVDAIRRGIEDVDGGRTKPADEVIRKLREEV